VGAFLRSLTWALRGVRQSTRTQANLRIQWVMAGSALALSFWLGAPIAPIALASALVIALELLNTALEGVVDLASPAPHPLARQAKDAAAGAVLVASFFAVLVGISTIGPPLWERLFGGMS
jgi:diacylglycerol kinase (ATP)